MLVALLKGNGASHEGQHVVRAARKHRTRTGGEWSHCHEESEWSLAASPAWYLRLLEFYGAERSFK